MRKRRAALAFALGGIAVLQVACAAPGPVAAPVFDRTIAQGGATDPEEADTGEAGAAAGAEGGAAEEADEPAGTGEGAAAGEAGTVAPGDEGVVPAPPTVARPPFRIRAACVRLRRALARTRGRFTRRQVVLAMRFLQCGRVLGRPALLGPGLRRLPRRRPLATGDTVGQEP